MDVQTHPQIDSTDERFQQKQGERKKEKRKHGKRKHVSI